MGHLASTLKAGGTRRVVSSSGGNAGHSIAHAGRALGLEVKVVVPLTTKPIMLQRIREQGAEVIVHGENWNAADTLARKMVEEDPDAAYISPYDNPLLWEGHSTVVDEIAEAGVRPGAIVASVGGGGLVCGLYEGLERHGWDEVTVVTAETEGAASFAASFDAGRIMRLDAITSIATSLGALQVCDAALERAGKQPTIAKRVTDAEAVRACLRFLEDHRIMVEPACGAALALVYSAEHRPFWKAFSSVVVEVCGGTGVSVDLFTSWRKDYCDD
jgi:L-serine/L-threonine ammonia-lyase